MTPSRLSRRHQRGLSLVETLIASTLAVFVFGAATALLSASNDLAQSASHERTAAMRVDRVLRTLGDEIRRGSLASARQLDGTTFSDGEVDTGLQIRPVEGFAGSPITGDLAEYRLDGAIAPEGRDLVRAEGPVITTLARGITGFDVRRVGNAIILDMSAASGPLDDRRREAEGQLIIVARNP